MTAETIVDFDPFFARLPDVDNAGISGDQQDLYVVYGEMEAYLQAHSPPFACQAGCIQCCNTQMPMVSSLEWQTLFAHIRTLPDVIQARIRHQAQMLRPLAGQFNAKRLEVFQSHGHVAGPSAQCPMLVEGQCSVYAARPLPCRVYGYTVALNGAQPQYLGCGLAVAHLREVAKDGLNLPSSQPFTKRMEELNEKNGAWTWAYLPQWVWAHVKDGEWIDEPVWVPDFRLV
jgi:Fe-S-cluster containining protein